MSEPDPPGTQPDHDYELVDKATVATLLGD